MRATSPFLALAALVAAVFAAGCASAQPIENGLATAQPQSEPRDRLTAIVPAPPEAALAVLRVEAERLGARITRETADSFTADFGVAPRRLEVRRGGASAQDAPTWLETEVHSSATYSARETEAGTVVTVLEDQSWWHPERHVWLRLSGPPAPSAVPAESASATVAGTK